MNHSLFIPVLLGNDINAYSMARAFHEQYGLISHVFCKFASGPCKNSDITICTVDERNETAAYLVSAINERARQFSDYLVLVVACGDAYVRLLSDNKHAFADNVRIPYMSQAELQPFHNKAEFYRLCADHGLDFPETIVVQPDMPPVTPSFEGPFVLKPADGVAYWEAAFPDQHKVYVLPTLSQLHQTIERIFAAGYQDSLIIQEYIPGGDEQLRTLTCYSDHQGVVRMQALGRVLLEDHSATGIGNSLVVVNEQNDDLCQRVRHFLEQTGYCFFSNFDIKYDYRDDTYKLFELNPRQARNNYYVTHSGVNLAQLLVQEHIEQRPFTGTICVRNQRLWRVIPHKDAIKQVATPALSELVVAHQDAGVSVNPLWYAADKNLVRKASLLKSQIQHVRNCRMK